MLQKNSSSTRSGPSSLSDKSGSMGTPAVFTLSCLEIKGWCGFWDRNTHGLTEAQARVFS